MRSHLPLLASCLGALALAVGCDRGLTGQDDDFSPPEMIDDLRIRTDDAAADAFTIEWTAPAADFNGGDVPSSSYEIYWGEEFITQQNADEMTLVEYADAPKAPGETESFRVEGLPQGPELYFAVAAYDGAGNVSFSVDSGQRAVAATAGAACADGASADEISALSESSLIRFQGCQEFAGQLILSDLAGVPGGFSSLDPLSDLVTINDGAWADWEEISDGAASLTIYGLQDVTSLDGLANLEEVEQLLLGLSDTESSLTELGLPKLRKVGNAFIAGWPEMTTASLPALEETVNLLDFDGLDAATRIELPAARRLELLYVENNPVLTTLSIPDVEHIESLDLVDNPELETLELPDTLTMFSLSVEGCPKLDPCELVTRFENVQTEDGSDVVYLDIEGMDACP